MTKFRPCIDLHAGEVKQIVGGTLDSTSEALKTNYVSKHPAEYYAQLYKDNELMGGHVIMLGPGNTQAARSALKAWPGGLQVGGGINDGNAKEWLEAGAEKVLNLMGSSTMASADRCRSSSRLTCFQKAGLAKSGSMQCCKVSVATRRNSSLTSAVAEEEKRAGLLR